jgi:toxin ParE1/3/4
MAEYRLSPAAERDLEGIWKYTRAEWGVEQAERYTDLLTAAFQVLAESPNSAPACDHIRRGYRRRNVERHMIYFRAMDYVSRSFVCCMSGWMRRDTCKTSSR